jgi:hypothetical protein
MRWLLARQSSWRFIAGATRLLRAECACCGRNAPFAGATYCGRDLRCARNTGPQVVKHVYFDELVKTHLLRMQLR